MEAARPSANRRLGDESARQTDPAMALRDLDDVDVALHRPSDGRREASRLNGDEARDFVTTQGDDREAIRKVEVAPSDVAHLLLDSSGEGLIAID